MTLLDERTIEAIREAIPVCPIHEIKMTPVSWYISKGKTTETDYACRKCIKEKEASDPVCLSSGPIIPYDWYWSKDQRPSLYQPKANEGVDILDKRVKEVKK